MTLLEGDTPVPPAVNITAWVLPISAGLLFIGLGYVKLFPSPDSMWLKTFDALGLGRWFMTLTGAMQLAGGLLFLLPRTALLGGIVCGTTMVGAMVAQVTRLDGAGAAVFPGLVLALVIAATVASRGR